MLRQMRKNKLIHRQLKVGSLTAKIYPYALFELPYSNVFLFLLKYYKKC